MVCPKIKVIHYQNNVIGILNFIQLNYIITFDCKYNYFMLIILS